MKIIIMEFVVMELSLDDIPNPESNIYHIVSPHFIYKLSGTE